MGTSKPVGLVLAAGAGRRMGRPKALLMDVSGEPWLARAVRALREGGCDPVVVVLGCRAAEAADLLEGVGVVVAEDWAEGLGASLRAGLAALGDRIDADAAVVTLVDLPDVHAGVVHRLVTSWHQEGQSPQALLRATYDGRPGHPVVLGREHWTPLREVLVGDAGALSYLQRHGAREIACEDLASGQDTDEGGPVSSHPGRRGHAS